MTDLHLLLARITGVNRVVPKCDARCEVILGVHLLGRRLAQQGRIGVSCRTGRMQPAFCGR
jgi:hypothetical protein